MIPAFFWYGFLGVALTLIAILLAWLYAFLKYTPKTNSDEEAFLAAITAIRSEDDYAAAAQALTAKSETVAFTFSKSPSQDGNGGFKATLSCRRRDSTAAIDVDGIWKPYGTYLLTVRFSYRDVPQRNYIRYYSHNWGSSGL